MIFGAVTRTRHGTAWRTGHVVALGCMLLLGAMPAGMAFEATVTVEPGVTPFHRPVILTLTVETPEGADATLPPAPRLGDDVLVSLIAEDDSARIDGGRRLVRQYELDAIRPAVYTVPAATVRLEDGRSLALPPIAFEARALSDAEQRAVAMVAPMALPREVLPPASWRGWIVAGVLFLVAAFVAAYWWYSRPTFEIAPVRMPWETAEARLQELAQRKLAEQGRYETYYVDLSAILRYYIEDRFHLRAPEQTTPEFLEAAANSGRLTSEQQQKLAAFLRESDRVKFARHVPDQESMSEAFGFVRGFVEETRPLPELDGEQQEAAA